MNTNIGTIDDYISQFPADIQLKLQEIRKCIKKAAPDATEAIKYAMPTFILHENLVHFAAFQNHIGFYPTPSGIESFNKELAVYKSGKGSVQFPINEPIPFKLITKIVEYRIIEANEKFSKKKKKK